MTEPVVASRALRAIASTSTAHVRTPRTHEPRPAEARCAEDAALFQVLRDIGIRCVSGPFTRAAWRGTCNFAGLYRLPLRADGMVLADLRRINGEADAIETKQTGWRFSRVDSPVAQAVHALRASGELLPSMFPRGEEYAHGRPVTVRFPTPPRLTLEVIHRANLAGIAMYVAAPAEAIRIKGIERAALEADPIVFGVVSRRLTGLAAHEEDGGKVLVFGHYATSKHDSEALKSLVAVLDGMTVKL
jgi:hypothetical protein